MKYTIFLVLYIILFSSLLTTTVPQRLNFWRNYAVKEAAYLTHRKIHYPLPKIIIIYNSVKFAKLACGNRDYKGCLAEAFYTFRTNTITLDGTDINLNTASGEAVLIHEMVHFLQGNILYNKKTCPSVEREAYDAQKCFFNEKWNSSYKKRYK